MGTATDNMVLAAAAGDPAAQGALVQKYQAPLEQEAAKFAPHSASGADHVQSAWILALKSFKTLREPRAIFAWLKTILQHVVLNAGRKKRAELNGSAILEQIPDDGTSPSRQMLGAEAIEEAVEAANELSPEQRLAVTMWYQQFNYAEIAAEMNNTEGAVRGLIDRGLKNLKKRLRPSDATS